MFDDPLARARRSLRALALGDAFGERFFVPDTLVERWLTTRRVETPAPWAWTDDTAMAISLVETLEGGELDLDAFAARLARRYADEPWRGYGAGAHDLLAQIGAGAPWERAATELFAGGSYGNGAAMRVAPLGAYYADDLPRCAAQAAASARVTHAHPEGAAGAVAVAIAAATFAGADDLEEHELVDRLYANVLAHTPPSEVRAGIERARAVRPYAAPSLAAFQLGNGARVSAMDTVPLCVWAATTHPRDLRATLWKTVEARGDRDTTCAIVAGILGASARTELPPELAANVEGVP